MPPRGCGAPENRQDATARGDEGEGGEGALLAAVIDNRAGEVGVAVLDAGGAVLLLTQHVETTRTFARTLALLAQYKPERLLVVAEAKDTGVGKASQFLEQVPLPRGLWDDSAGFVTLTKYATPDARAALEAGMLQSLAGGYLAYAAAGALLRFIEQPESGLLLAAGSLAVQHIASDSHMHIDQATAAALELIHPVRVGTCSSKLSGMSLFRVLDKTKTRAGARLLRANLLQPLRDVPTLEMRYDCVEELAQDDELAFNVATCLGRMPKDLDRMCGSLGLRPACSETGIQRRIAAMILLHETVAVLPPLAEALAGAQCELLRTVGVACGHIAFTELQKELEGVLEKDVQTSNNTFLNRTQQCFAVSAGVNGFLDVARATFCRVTEQVHELAERLRQQHRLPGMLVNYATKKGFYFVLRAGGGSGHGGRSASRGGRGSQKHPRDCEDESSALEGGSELEQPAATSTAAGSHWVGGTKAPAADGRSGGRGQQGGRGNIRVPPGFVVLQRAGQSAVHATTSELNALNARLRDASTDCMVLTEQVLDEVTQRIVGTYMPLLHRLVDSIALLDMLAGFSLVATGCGTGSSSSAARTYVRPVLTESGPLALVEARHPVLECLDGGHSFQPNDTYLALNSSFHIITGPNMSGKSTYLRQVALCVVMAQVGAFVPASFASLTPCDRLLSRIGTGDSLETNSSSFMVEAQEVAYILAHATERSLVLIDELGRATSTADGVALAWAVGEQLIALGAPTLFATHFNQLTELTALYPAAKAWHFGLDASRSRLDFSWRLQSGGVCEAGHYGLLLAAAVGFPPEVLRTAEEVVEALDSSEGQRIQAYATPATAELEVVYDMVHKLVLVAQSFAATGGSDVRRLQKQLKSLQVEAAEALAPAATATPAPAGGA